MEDKETPREARSSDSMSASNAEGVATGGGEAFRGGSGGLPTSTTDSTVA